MDNKFIKSVAEAVKKSVSLAVDGLKAALEPRITALENASINKEYLEKALSLSESELLAVLDEKIADKLAAIPAAKDGVDGKSVDMEEIRALIAKSVEEALNKIEIPEPKHGRDALNIDILGSIDEKKSYERGVYATHRGGLWHAWKKTEGMKGWECIVDGTFKTVVAQDGERDFSFIVEKSSGALVQMPFRVPAMIYKFIYEDNKEYDEGDTVTWGGSVWYCKEKTSEKPHAGSKFWHLAVKHGRDAKQKVKI